MSLAEELESLADLLEASNKKKRLKKVLQVWAFAGIGANGKPFDPVGIKEGDELYLQGINDPMSGILTKDPTQRPFGRALQAIAAGMKAEIKVGLYEKIWITDENPCPVCDENSLAGWIPMDEMFPSGDDEPLAHPNCFIGGTAVTSGEVLAATARHFQGEIILIGVGGKDLSVTPNHPILTDRGWLAAGSLKIGDRLVQCGNPALAAALIDPYHHYVETRIEQVFDAAVMSDGVTARRVPTAPVDFHGDVSPDGEVDIVWPTGSLRNDTHRDAAEFSEHLIFALCDRLRIPLSRDGAGAQLLIAANDAPNRGMGGGSHTLALPGRSLLVTGSASSLASAVLEPEPFPSADDRAARDPYANGDREDALARTMRFVEVTEIERRQFDGQVYNLETASGFYLAETIIAHNCYCELETRRGEVD